MRNDVKCGIIAPKGMLRMLVDSCAPSRSSQRAPRRAAQSWSSPSVDLLEERAEHRGPSMFEVAVSLESALEQSLDSLLRFRPRQRGQKAAEGVQEAVGGWQRDLVNEILRRRDRTPVEGGDPARERVDEAVEFRVQKCPVDVSVSFRGVAVKVVRAENDFERAATTDQVRESFRTAAAGMHSHSDFGLAQYRVLARREAHVAGEDELTAHAPDTASDLRDADHRGLGQTDERIHQDREAGRPDRCGDVPRLAGQIKVSEVEVRIRALEYNDTQARARVHSCEQILEPFEYGAVHNVERRIIEH